MSSRSRLSRAVLLGAAGAAALYVLLAGYAGAARVKHKLARFDARTAAVALGLAAMNYLLRFAKWETYLRRLQIRVPLGRSLAIFLSGFALTVTPGKVGEVLKFYLLRETDGVPMARSAPTLVAERLTDSIALILLALTGVGSLKGGTRLIWLPSLLIVAFLALLSSERRVEQLIQLLARIAPRLELASRVRAFYSATRVVLGPRPLVLTTLLSIGAWAAECLAFWFVLRGFPGASATIGLCTFIYAAMTIGGGLSFIPGGLGVQEGGMVALLVTTAHGVSTATAFAATFVVRLCTLWFAVLVGLVALSLIQRRIGVRLDRLSRGDNEQLPG